MEAFEQLIEQIAPNLYAYRDRFFTSFAATFEMFAKARAIATRCFWPPESWEG